MNKMKKIFSILLMVVFLVNTFLGSTSKNAFADGTLKTQLRIINLNGDGTIDENTEFWVNKDIPAAADLTVSGTGVNIQNPKLKITVQKTNSTTRPEFVDSQKAVKNERTEDNDNYYMTYSFDRLNGGAKLTFPMPFKFLESANKGDTVTIKEELFDENGGLIDSATKTYVANKVGYTFNDSSVYADTPDQLQQLIDPSKPAKNNTLFVRKVDDYTDSDKTKEDGEGTQVNSYYNFTVKDTATVDPNATYMSPENIKIELKLPEGVDVMDGRFSFDPATRTATRIVNKPSLDRVWKGSYNEIVYWFGTGLLFKGKKYNEVINIEAKFTVNAGLADEKKLPDRTLPIKLEKNKLTFGAQRWTEVLKYKLNAQGNDPVPNRVNNGVYTLYNNKLFDDWNNDQTDNGLMYITRIGNENNGSSPTNPGGGIRLHLWEIEDVLMRDKPVQDEKKIYYKYFQLGKVEKFRDRGGDDTRRQQLVDDAINQVNSTPNKLYGIKEDGSKVELASNIKLGQRVDINDTTGQYTRLSLVFERPISLDNTALFYYTGAYPSEKEIKKFEDGEYDKEQYYYGSEHIVAEEAENATTKENAKKSEGNSIWAWTGLRLPTPKAYIGNFNGTGVLPYKADGTYADIHLDHASLRGRYGAWGPYLGKPVTNPKIIYLLPAEFSFVKTKAIATNGIDKSKIGEPEVIKNFRNTGRTAVIYSLPDITPTLEDKNDTIWMDLQIEASPYAKQGNNQVDVFYTYDNNDIIQPWNDDQTYVDELDLDGDGNKKEKFTHRKHDINFIPPLELLMYKNVGLTTDNMRYAEVGDVGEPFYWKVSINNNTISEVTDISFIDTLPFVGDHVITPNKKGEYKERGSKFMTPLANSLESVKANEEVLKNFDVYYQLKPQNILETVRDGEWLSKDQVTDFSQVKSIKVMLKPGAKLASKTTVDFYIPSKIPFDTTLTETQTANNSVAISTDKYSYSEANTATIGVARYTIKGTVFSDFNKDGLMTDNEEKLSGYKVELIDKKTGDVAVDVNGQKLETTTDNEGKYTINAYKRGDYFVRFTKLSDEDVLTKSNDKANGNNATEEIAGTKFVKTADFALSPTNNNIVKNAGFEGTKRDVTVEKVDSQLNQDGSKKYLANAIFELKQNGTVVDTQTTDQNGRAVFKGVKFGSYKLVETKAPTGYAAVNTEKDITVDENGDAKYEIANDLVLGKVEVTKVDKDDPTKKLKGVKFVLKQGNDEKYEATTGEDGKAVFDGVLFGSYKLVEKETLENYKADSTEHDVTIDNQTKLKEVTIKNELKKGKVVVTKVDATDNTKKLQGVKFALKQDGNVKYEVETDADGKAVFNGVAYGKYKLVETKPLDNYLPDTTERDVNIDADGKEVPFEITNALKEGKVEVTKVDADDNSKKLEGVKFALKQGNDVKYEATTDADGKAVFNGVAYGDYKLVETKHLDNYNADTTERDVTIDSQNTIKQLTITNTLIKGKVEVTLVDAVVDGKPIKGATFVLKQGDTVLKEVVTDDSGKVVFENVPYGEYTVVEKTTLENYVIDSAPKAVKIEQQGQVEKVQVINVLKTSNVKVTKVDADDNTKKLAGVEFELRGANGKVLKGTTNANGEYIFEDVVYGDYKLVETKTLDNYNLTTTEETVQVRDAGQTIEKTVTNALKKGKVEVTKVDADDNIKKLAGVKFELKQGDEVKYEGTTDANGKLVIDNVIYGDYKLVEKETLENYNLNKEVVDVSIKAQGQLVEKTVENTLKKGKVEVTAVDADDNTKKLPGIKFVLKQGDEVKYEGTTDANGKLVFDKVIYGDYKLVEKETLENYNLNKDQFDISIKEEGQLVEKTVPNLLKKGKVEVTKVDAEDNTKKLAGVKFALKQGNDVKYEGTTDANGKLVFDKVVYGDYKLVETETLENYNLNKDQFDVSIKEEGQLVEKTVTNQIIKSDIKFVKVDAKDNNKKLAGVKFVLKQGDVEKYEAVSDANGVVSFKGVVYGEYTLVEKETIAGYKLSTETKQVQVRTHGVVIDLGNFANEPIVKAPGKKTGSLAKTGLAETSTTLLGTMLLALAMLFRRKSTK
ncbi:SpaA isopeptide-forming pilin-related protein [Gemella morbillorum]|uniref:SpaA isopeptide-forming pilin-related protein n=2 Tax=Gemella morbillorum TaxID=29391 RepID=UPI001CAEBF35|nr:SpaA isopeptide-forming pilin-related protein [Gemella morbillorum]MBF1211974.1 hypothetical protein [Gemella morbillorum]